MTSYASIDRIEGKRVICEVELVPFEESKPEDFITKACEMLDVPLQEIPEDIGEVKEGDILLVKHDGKKIITIYYKDEEEKERRFKIRKDIKC